METKNSPSRMGYRADIDGLRAVAVLLVLVFHFSLVPAITAGFLGVDIFFVISGFLITGILLRQLDSGSLNLATFYINRVRRLAPALSATLIGVMLVGLVWLFPKELIELTKQIFVSQFYVANIYFWRHDDYFGLRAHSVYLLHTWSLGVEEQFYLFYPLLLILLYRYLKVFFWYAILFAFIISFGVNVFLVESKPWATFYLLPPRAWQLLLGAMVLPVAGYWKRRPLVDQLIALIGVALIVVSVTFYRKNIFVPGYYALLPTLGAACLLLSGTNCATYVARFLSLAPVAYIGAISYPLYLVHWPIAVFSTLNIPESVDSMGRVSAKPSTSFNIMMFGLSIVLAAVIYHFVEHPIRAKRWLSARPKLLMGYGAGLAVTALFLSMTFGTDGLPRRFPANVLRLAAYANDSPPPLAECGNDEVKSKFHWCRIGAAGVTPTWFIYGDSHAWAAHSAFDRWLKSRGEAGLFAFMFACIPINGVHTFGDAGDACFKFNRDVTRIIEDNPNLKNIVPVSMWTEAEGLSTSTKTLVREAESLKLFEHYFLISMKHLNELGRKVFVWEPVPGAKLDVPQGLARAALNGGPENLEFSLAEYHSMYRYFFQALGDNRSRIYATFSPSQFLCSSGACRVELDGRPLYADGNHMSNSTADIWVNVLTAPIRKTHSVNR